MLNAEKKRGGDEFKLARRPRGSLQQHQGYVILLLPSLAGKALQFAEHEIDEWRPIGMLCEQGLEARKAEHLTPVIMSLYQAVAVEKQALSRRQHCFVFIVTCARQQPKRHASRPEFCGATSVPAIWRFMSCIGVAQAPAFRVKKRVEAGDKHPGWNLSGEQVIDPR